MFIKLIALELGIFSFDKLAFYWHSICRAFWRLPVKNKLVFTFVKKENSNSLIFSLISRLQNAHVYDALKFGTIPIQIELC